MRADRRAEGKTPHAAKLHRESLAACQSLRRVGQRIVGLVKGRERHGAREVEGSTRASIGRSLAGEA
jgi:hypothetical protein